MFNIKMISQDKQVYLFNSYSTNKNTARKEAIADIVRKGWEHHNYKIAQVVEILVPDKIK